MVTHIRLTELLELDSEAGSAKNWIVAQVALGLRPPVGLKRMSRQIDRGLVVEAVRSLLGGRVVSIGMNVSEGELILILLLRSEHCRLGESSSVIACLLLFGIVGARIIVVHVVRVHLHGTDVAAIALVAVDDEVGVIARNKTALVMVTLTWIVKVAANTL